MTSMLRIADDFLNIRGSFKVGGLIDVGTQCSLVRRANGRFVSLDSYTLSGAVQREVDRLTNGGKDVEAILNVHPFHTVHVRAMHQRYPKARLYGTARHLSRLRGIEEGNRLASVPELQLAATATYTFPVDLFGSQEAYVSGSFQHVGDRITQPSDQVPGAGDFVSGLPFGGATGEEGTSVDLELDAYELLNLSAGLTWETWEAVLYVNNVTDENANLSFDRERGGRARLGIHTNQPRTVGLTLRAKF